MVSFPSLAEALDADASRYGGKGANLARLAARSLPVPPGFLIDADSVAAIVSGDAPALDALEVALERLGPGPVAVRSSASGEDGATASFAGQHETVLDVEGKTAIVDAIRRCAESAAREHVAAYRKDAGIDPGQDRMAVVVQRMVPADAAGVAFTADPATGDSTRIVVEAVRGLGTSLVDGTAEADRFVFDRRTMEVSSRHHPGAPALTDEVAEEVARLALTCEAVFGNAQDIEFAVHDGTVWVLQSRPVTTLNAAGGGWFNEFDTPTAESDVWTSANVQEVLPGLLTPYTITAFQEHLHTAYTAGYQELRLLKKNEWPQFVGVFYNRAFLSVNATRLIAERAIGASGDSVEHRFLGAEQNLAPSGNRFQNIGRKAWSLPFLLRLSLQINNSVERAERKTLEWERRVRTKDFAALTDAQFESWRERASRFAAGIAKVHLRATGIAGTGFEWTAGMVRPILGDETEARLPLLFSGMPGIESAQISVDLWALSREALAAGLADQLAEPGFDPLAPGLPPAWRTRFSAFMERHGHRGLNEMEAAALPWRRDPAPVFQIIRSYFDVAEDHSPPVSLERQERERLRLTAELEGQMKPVARSTFRRILSDGQRGVTLRERMKSVMVRAMRLGDYMLPSVQDRLVRKGCIQHPDDVFFVTQDEIHTILATGEAPDLRERIARRRREYERNRYVLLPERFAGRPVPMAPEAHAEGATVLKGTPVSPGIITARARVILDPSRDAPLLPGEILVAPVTDAGWTPMFALASGLVVDMGSALSHGSTVAREYGLPGVVNVRGATRIIRSGDLLTIDGGKGTVTVVPAEDETAT